MANETRLLIKYSMVAFIIVGALMQSIAQDHLYVAIGRMLWLLALLVLLSSAIAQQRA
jgi:hypothetical protein